MVTEELIYTKTSKEIKKMIDREYKDIAIKLKFGIITEAEAKKENDIIKMVELTLANSYIA